MLNKRLRPYFLRGRQAIGLNKVEIRMSISQILKMCYTSVAHPEDRATLGSDPSAEVSDLWMGARSWYLALIL